MSELIIKGQKAKEASYELSNASTNTKNNALLFMAEELINEKEAILKANAIDIEYAKENGISEAMLDRLSLN